MHGPIQQACNMILLKCEGVTFLKYVIGCLLPHKKSDKNADAFKVVIFLIKRSLGHS